MNLEESAKLDARYRICNKNGKGTWYADEENACVRDERHCPEGVDSIVWEYTTDAEYRA